MRDKKAWGLQVKTSRVFMEMWYFLVRTERSRMKQPNHNMCLWKITCNNCNPEPSHNKVKVKLHEQLKLWHFLSFTYLALQPKHFVLLVIFYSIYETHSACPLFISNWCLKGNGIKPWGFMGFVWQKKITGGLVVIILWPFVLRNCRVKYCPQDRRKKKKVVSVLHEEISALSSRQSQPQQPPIPWWYFSMFSLCSQSLWAGKECRHCGVLCAHSGLFWVSVRSLRFVPSNSGHFILCSLNMYMQKAFS